jgi:hypothetical protein
MADSYADVADEFNQAAQRYTDAMRQFAATAGQPRAAANVEANAAAQELDELLPRLIVTARAAGYRAGSDTDSAVLGLIVPAGHDHRRVWTAWRKLSNRWAALHLQGITVSAPPEDKLCRCDRASG